MCLETGFPLQVGAVWCSCIHEKIGRSGGVLRTRLSLYSQLTETHRSPAIIESALFFCASPLAHTLRGQVALRPLNSQLIVVVAIVGLENQQINRSPVSDFGGGRILFVSACVCVYPALCVSKVNVPHGEVGSVSPALLASPWHVCTYTARNSSVFLVDNCVGSLDSTEVSKPVTYTHQARAYRLAAATDEENAFEQLIYTHR